MFEMTTKDTGTRIREWHNTFSNIVTSVNADVTVQGDEVWTAGSDGIEVKNGDQWLHVTSPAVGWMAYIHKGVPICRDLHEVGADPLPESEFTAAVHVGEMGVYAIKLEGDETKPFNLLMNGRVIFTWP